MTQRSQMIALAAIVIAVVGIFVLVASSGVSTRVFSAEPTAVPPTPTATPIPEASADHWVQTGENQLTYTDPSVQVAVDFGDTTLATFVEQNQLGGEGESSAFPLLDALKQVQVAFDEQVASLGIAPDTITIAGPALELVGETTELPAATLRYTIGPNLLADGTDFPGTDIAFVLLDRGEDNITYVRYQQSGEYKPQVYADFRAWLARHATEVAEASAATPEAETPEAGSTETAPAETPEAAPTEAAPTEAAPTTVPPTETAPTEVPPTAAPTASPTPGS